MRRALSLCSQEKKTFVVERGKDGASVTCGEGWGKCDMWGRLGVERKKKRNDPKVRCGKNGCVCDIWGGTWECESERRRNT